MPRSPVARAGFWLYASQLWGLFSIALSNTTLGLSLLLLPWSADRRGLPRAARPLLVAAGLYVGWLLVAVLTSYEPLRSARSLSEIFSLGALIVGLLVVRDERQARLLRDGLIVLATLLAAAGLSQFFVGYGDLENRIRGPLSHYMTFSGILLIADLLLLSKLAVGDGWRNHWRWLSAALINAALIASLTRSAWVGLGAAVTLLILIRARRLLLLAPLAGLAFFVLAPSPVVERIGSIVDLQDPSNYDRLCMAAAGIEMVVERPITGQGPRLVRERYPIYRHPTAPRYWVPHLHNSTLQLGAERGLPGLAAYLFLMIYGGLAAWRRYRRALREGGAADLYLGAFLGLVAFNVAGLFEDNWSDSEVQRVALFLLILPFVSRTGEPQAETAVDSSPPGISGLASATHEPSRQDSKPPGSS